MAGDRPTVNALAQRIVRELTRTGVAREDVVAALLVAAWAMVSSRTDRPHASGKAND